MKAQCGSIFSPLVSAVGNFSRRSGVRSLDARDALSVPCWLASHPGVELAEARQHPRRDAGILVGVGRRLAVGLARAVTARRLPDSPLQRGRYRGGWASAPAPHDIGAPLLARRGLTAERGGGGCEEVL